jgi:hypothetical protein
LTTEVAIIRSVGGMVIIFFLRVAPIKEASKKSFSQIEKMKTFKI